MGIKKCPRNPITIFLKQKLNSETHTWEKAKKPQKYSFSSKYHIFQTFSQFSLAWNSVINFGFQNMLIGFFGQLLIPILAMFVKKKIWGPQGSPLWIWIVQKWVSNHLDKVYRDKFGINVIPGTSGTIYLRPRWQLNKSYFLRRPKGLLWWYSGDNFEGNLEFFLGVLWDHFGGTLKINLEVFWGHNGCHFGVISVVLWILFQSTLGSL